MAKMMSIKSLFIPKEMWACSHPKTESFRMAPEVYRNLNSMYIESEANDTISELGNWFESDSSAASTSEISSSEDSGEAPELFVEGLVRGLCSDRFFFEPDCAKSIVEKGKDKASCFLPFVKAGSGLETEKNGKFSLFKENKKVGSSLEREKNDGFLLLKENKKMGSGLERQTNDGFLILREDKKLAGGIKNEVDGGLLTLKEQLKKENGFEMEEEDSGDVVPFKESRGQVGSDLRKKSNGFLVFDEEINVEREKDEELFGMDGDAAAVLPFDESWMMVMDSEDPYRDFRVSMEEMVEAYDLSEWECLEEMLMWYLSVNGKSAHRYIMGAFVDLLVSLVSPSHGNGVEVLRRF